MKPNNIINYCTNKKNHLEFALSKKKISKLNQQEAINERSRTFTAGTLKGQLSTFPSVRAPQISYIAQYPADFLASTPYRILHRICIGKFKPKKQQKNNSDN